MSMPDVVATDKGQLREWEIGEQREATETGVNKEH